METESVYFYVRNSAHQTVQPDPKFGVEEQWAASVMMADDYKDEKVCTVYGEDATDAITNASKVSKALNDAYGAA